MENCGSSGHGNGIGPDSIRIRFKDYLKNENLDAEKPPAKQEKPKRGYLHRVDYGDGTCCLSFSYSPDMEGKNPRRLDKDSEDYKKIVSIAENRPDVEIIDHNLSDIHTLIGTMELNMQKSGKLSA